MNADAPTEKIVTQFGIATRQIHPDPLQARADAIYAAQRADDADDGCDGTCCDNCYDVSA